MGGGRYLTLLSEEKVLFRLGPFLPETPTGTRLRVEFVDDPGPFDNGITRTRTGMTPPVPPARDQSARLRRP